MKAVRVAQPTVADLAVLDLERDVPRGVTAASLRCPSPDDMVGRTWWAFGFPGHDPIGNAADGTVGASLGYGWDGWTPRRVTTWNPGSAVAACGRRSTRL